MTFQNPNLVVDSQSFKTKTPDDQNSDLFPQLHEFPQRYSVSSPQTADSAADACYQGPKQNKLNPELTTGEKIQVLVETLNPIPFMPSEALDFKTHESLLRRLGLWDFVNIEFDTTIRSDLLAQLIASYSPNLRGGYVNLIKIMVNRADLGRALKLPTEPTAASPENVVGTLESAESIAFIEKFVSMWMLLHDDEWIMPPEVFACIRLIKEGNLEMIDWAGLIWRMVDIELKASQLDNCYYASHLQHLIKTQHEELLKEEEEELLREHDNESSEEQDDVEIFEEEKDQFGDKHSMDVEDFKEESGQCPFLRRCNVIDLNCSAKEEEEFDDEDEDEDDCILVRGMSSGISSEGEDAQMVSGNGHKRYVDQDDDYNLYQSPIIRNKRLRRSDSLWDFNMCMENIQHLIGEARMMHIKKAQACEESSMNQQLLLNELHNRDMMIEHLRKEHLQESQKGRVQVYKLERELYMMGKLLEGYKKALKETQKAFTEYRIHCPQASEQPLYKDVPGSGGLVLSVMEIEQERLKQEEQQQMKRLIIEKTLRDFEEDWIGMLEKHQNRIHSLGERLVVVEDQAKLFIKINGKC